MTCNRVIYIYFLLEIVVINMNCYPIIRCFFWLRKLCHQPSWDVVVFMFNVTVSTFNVGQTASNTLFVYNFCTVFLPLFSLSARQLSVVKAMFSVFFVRVLLRNFPNIFNLLWYVICMYTGCFLACEVKMNLSVVVFPKSIQYPCFIKYGLFMWCVVLRCSMSNKVMVERL